MHGRRRDARYVLSASYNQRIETSPNVASSFLVSLMYLKKGFCDHPSANRQRVESAFHPNLRRSMSFAVVLVAFKEVMMDVLSLVVFTLEA